ncbi:carbohydrate ABC transporter substrate-binding protein [Pleurocapsales cyanobacterium LEGE 10410]|nr:carbohydrate ABC transporter substrate-binding protein [Pleurocapsales cyanobacterium LEGE 10410]
MTKKLLSYFALVIITLMLVIACNSDTRLQHDEVATRSPTNTDVLQIWWDKGYILKEDEAIHQIVDAWQQKSNQKAEVKFYTADEITQKTRRAIQAGNPPDVLFSSRAEYPLLAWQGKLADVSSVVEPVEQLYTTTSRTAAYLYNNVEEKRSYYSVPLHQGTIHIFYWQDLLNRVGKDTKDIPQDWDKFWEFWKTIQLQLQPEQPDIYALGIPYSQEASDTYYLFEQILEAYNVAIFDDLGNLQIDKENVRQGIVDCLEWYADFYERGYIPSSALNWLDPDNNREFLNRKVVMTPNPTLSIAIALNENREVSANNLGMMEFPNKPDGNPIRHLVSVRQAVVLADAKNQKTAQDFLTFLIQPEVIGNYLKSAGGRYLPAIKAARQDSFWTNPQNLPVATATKTLTQSATRLFYSARYPAYSLVLEQNIWGQALNSIVVDKISPEQAADEAIAQIKQIFAEWER